MVVIAANGSVVDVPTDREEVDVASAKELGSTLRSFLASSASALVLRSTDSEQLWDWFRARYTFVQAAGGTVTDENGRLLVMHRRGMWDLPKGKVDKGEAIADAAVREVMEECGLKHVEIVKQGSGSRTPIAETWHTYEHKGEDFLKRTDWFLMEASSREELVAEAEEDITEVKWMTDDEVVQMRRVTYPTLRAVIDAWRSAMGLGR